MKGLAMPQSIEIDPSEMLKKMREGRRFMQRVGMRIPPEADEIEALAELAVEGKAAQSRETRAGIELVAGEIDVPLVPWPNFISLPPMDASCEDETLVNAAAVDLVVHRLGRGREAFSEIHLRGGAVVFTPGHDVVCKPQFEVRDCEPFPDEGR